MKIKQSKTNRIIHGSTLNSLKISDHAIDWPEERSLKVDEVLRLHPEGLTVEGIKAVIPNISNDLLLEFQENGIIYQKDGCFFAL
jgi:hypothetical protein